MLARDAPVVALFGSDDGNRLTFAVSDALNATRLTSGVREEDGLIYNQVHFFVERHKRVSRVRLELRLDRRAVRYEESLADVADWWASHDGYRPAAVPEAARQPMYSTWYSYHQNVYSEPLLEEIELARSLGLTAIIIDDGWQTLDSNRGYPYTGDWEPAKIPDMKQFVDEAHARDMKVLLWYAISLVGERSSIFERFEGKYLRYWDGQGAWELDPRYPEVRDHIIGTYAAAMRNWGVDGFKLDFIARFVANDATILEAADGRDYGSVNEATDRLFTDLLSTLREIDPEVMIEFRQPYIGPLMRKYGNMFRAGDSPNAAVTNRVRVVDLRLLSGSTAVHSDMIMWHYDEPVEIAALQFLNILFSVPQVSVRLADVPVAHRDMVAFWVDYWSRNRDVLLDGAFTAEAPLINYPVVRANGNGVEIIARYADVVIDLLGEHRSRIDIVNAARNTEVVARVAEDMGGFRATVTNARGAVVDSFPIELAAGLHSIPVPVSGMASLTRIR
jgi:alpha-galactosidase